MDTNSASLGVLMTIAISVGGILSCVLAKTAAVRQATKIIENETAELEAAEGEEGDDDDTEVAEAEGEEGEEAEGEDVNENGAHEEKVLENTEAIVDEPTIVAPPPPAPEAPPPPVALKSDLDALRVELMDQFAAFNKKHESHDYNVDSLMRTAAAHNQKMISINEQNENQLNNLNNRITSVESNRAVEVIQTTMNQFDSVVKNLTQNVGSLENLFETSINTLTESFHVYEDTTTQALSGIVERQATFHQKIADHSTKLAAIDLTKPDETESLKNQITTLAAQVSEITSLKNQIIILSTQVSEITSLKNQITLHDGSLGLVTAQNDALKAEVTKCQSDLALSSASNRLTGTLIQDLTKQTKALESRLVAQEAVVDTHSAPLKFLQDSVQAQDAVIAKVRKGLEEVASQSEGIEEIVNKIGIIEVALEKKNKAKKGGLFG
jgi:hypothetical protein